MDEVEKQLMEIWKAYKRGDIVLIDTLAHFVIRREIEARLDECNIADWAWSLSKQDRLAELRKQLIKIGDGK